MNEMHLVVGSIIACMVLVASAVDLYQVTHTEQYNPLAEYLNGEIQRHTLFYFLTINSYFIRQSISPMENYYRSFKSKYFYFLVKNCNRSKGLAFALKKDLTGYFLAF